MFVRRLLTNVINRQDIVTQRNLAPNPSDKKDIFGMKFLSVSFHWRCIGLVGVKILWSNALHCTSGSMFCFAY